MITQWKVSNFKSIREETELDLGSLTIFAGANSSGKSTFIQSMLLVAQTLLHKVGSRSVVLNGAYASLGQFDDIKSNNSTSDQIAIGCICRPFYGQNALAGSYSGSPFSNSIYYGSHRTRLAQIACNFTFDADPSSPERDVFQIQ